MSDQVTERIVSASVLVQPVQTIRGVGPRLARHLRAKGLLTIEDLLFNLPLGYLDQRGGVQISRLRPGDYVSFVAEVFSAQEVRYRRRKIFEVTLSDGTGMVTAKWFRYGRWLTQRFQRFKGELRVSGTLRVFGRQLEIHHPEVEEVDQAVEAEASAILPRYSPIPGVAPRTYRRIMKEVVSTLVSRVPETLPEPVRNYFKLLDLRTALRQVHFPDELPVTQGQRQLSPGLRRLVFEELFFLELQILIKYFCCPIFFPSLG